jgi:large subunit ribosomal protein L30
MSQETDFSPTQISSDGEKDANDALSNFEIFKGKRGKQPKKPRAQSELPEIKITQIKSTIGRIPTHRRTARSLGLRRIGHTVVHRDHPTIRGMINQISYLVKVESVDKKDTALSAQE